MLKIKPTKFILDFDGFLVQVLEQEYGCKLCIEPCKDREEVRPANVCVCSVFALIFWWKSLFGSLLLQGFYYDAFYGDLSLNEQHFPNIEAGVAKAARVLLLLQ